MQTFTVYENIFVREGFVLFWFFLQRCIWSADLQQFIRQLVYSTRDKQLAPLSIDLAQM